MVLPRIKKLQTLDGSFLLPYDIKLSVSDTFAENAKELTALFLPKTSVVLAADGAHIVATQAEQQKHPEEYSLVVSPSGIQITYCTYIGLRNALATVSMMASATAEGYALDCVQAEDYPVSQHRGIMLDLARGIKPLDILMADMVLIAKAKMNILHLHLSDNKGMSVRLDWLPEAYLWENCYTKDDMRRLIRLAEILALEIIPEFDLPAHSKKLTACMPEFACDVDDTEENTRWTVCAGTEEVYAFYEKVIAELAELFPGKYFHIGADELEFRNRPEIKQLCHWNYCRKCQAKMAKEGLKDRQELFYYLINRVHAMVKKSGKTMIMWSDQLDFTRPAGLPTDIIMQYWLNPTPGRGTVENYSMNSHLAYGYKVINSYFKETYIDFPRYMNEEHLADFRWDQRPEIEPQYAENVLGFEICAWEYGNAAKYQHYNRSLAPTLVAAADKQWNGDVMVFDKAYRVALTDAVLGNIAPHNVDLFHCVGSIMPPKDDSYAHWDKLTCSKEDVENTLARLQALTPMDFGQAFRVNAYIDMLEHILQEWDTARTAGELLDVDNAN